MFPTLLRRLAEPPNSPMDGIGSSVLTRKVWPPNFSKLSPQEQLRFEKKYKRRIALAAARPRWVKFVKLAQLGTITSVIVYAVLFMNSDSEQQPFDGLRKRFWDSLGFEPRSRPAERTRPGVSNPPSANR